MASSTDRSSRPEVFCKKDVFRNFAKYSQENICTRVFSSEFCGISKNIFSYRTPPVAASAVSSASSERGTMKHEQKYLLPCVQRSKLQCCCGTDDPVINN